MRFRIMNPCAVHCIRMCIPVGHHRCTTNSEVAQMTFNICNSPMTTWTATMPTQPSATRQRQLVDVTTVACNHITHFRGIPLKWFTNVSLEVEFLISTKAAFNSSTFTLTQRPLSQLHVHPCPYSFHWSGEESLLPVFVKCFPDTSFWVLSSPLWRCII